MPLSPPNPVTSTGPGLAPASASDATKFLNSAATPAYAQVKDSDLATTDITTNDVSITKHGFAPKAPGDGTKYLSGTNPPAWSVPAATLTNGQRIGAGTAYTFTTSLADITFGTTSLATTLAAGVYIVFATIEVTDAGVTGDTYNFSLAWNDGESDNLIGVTQNITATIAGDKFVVSLVATVTIVGTNPVKVQGQNSTSARGTVVSTKSSLCYLKIG